MNFAIFANAFYYIIDTIDIMQVSKIIYEVLKIRIPWGAIYLVSFQLVGVFLTCVQEIAQRSSRVRFWSR